MKLTRLAVLLSLAWVAQAFAYTPVEFTGSLANVSPIQNSPIAGDTYLITPGIGGAGGFAFSMANAVDSVIDGASEVVGETLVAPAVDVLSSDSVVDNGGNNFTLTLNISSAGDLAPTGFNVGMLPANVAGLFLGGNAGGDPIDFPNPAIVTLATVEGFDVAGASAFGPFDITGFSNFTAGPGGGWNGGVGVTFGAGSVGDIGGYELVVNYNMVPEPSSLALIGITVLCGLAVRRRR